MKEKKDKIRLKASHSFMGSVADDPWGFMGIAKLLLDLLFLLD